MARLPGVQGGLARGIEADRVEYRALGVSYRALVAASEQGGMLVVGTTM